jgi:hypothetical protein
MAAKKKVTNKAKVGAPIGSKNAQKNEEPMGARTAFRCSAQLLRDLDLISAHKGIKRSSLIVLELERFAAREAKRRDKK